MATRQAAHRRIDLGGDITALSTGDFERLKHIVNKGRGKDMTPPNGEHYE